MLQWLIIGGGPHGAYLSHVLTGACSVKKKDVAVLDPEPELLACWYRNTRNTGMTHLRSPIVHHIDLDPSGLRKYARDRREPKCCIAPYDRPSLTIFNDHCRDVIHRHGLAEMHHRGKALSIDLESNHVRVETDQGVLRARRVITALGSAAPRVPDWAVDLQERGAPIYHLFSDQFETETLETEGLTVVLGGGISASQFASRMAERDAEQVVILARNKPRVHQFDSDPGWLGPKYMNRFKRAKTQARRQLISGARHVGSMPSDVYRRLQGHLNAGRINWVQGEVAHVSLDDGLVLLRTEDQVMVADRLVLATGFNAEPPGKSMLAQLADKWNLPLATCGYPVTDRFLRWHARLFLAGGQGELTLGPVARNIAGARRAGNLIKSLLRAS